MKNTREEIFTAMELSKNPYSSIIEMPVYELSNYLDWKIKLDKERQKQQEEAMSGMK